MKPLIRSIVLILLIILGSGLVFMGLLGNDLDFAAKTATYGNFDIPGTIAWVNRLKPGIADKASQIIYGKFHAFPLIAITVLFILMPIPALIGKTGEKTSRILSQWSFFVLARLGVFRVAGICPVQRTQAGVFPFLNCMACEMATGACPVGMLQWSLIHGHFPYFVTGILVLSGVVFGRAICGWMCPFGFVLDVLDRLSLKKIRPAAIFYHLKYFILFSLFSAPFWTSALFCAYICQSGKILGLLPYYLTTGLGAFKQQIQTGLWWQNILGFHLLSGFILISGIILVSGRWFCRYLCPLGAWYGLFNRIAPVCILHDESQCTRCKKCLEVCPMGVDLLKDNFTDRSNCILCGRCTQLCDARTITPKLSIPLINKEPL